MEKSYFLQKIYYDKITFFHEIGIFIGPGSSSEKKNTYMLLHISPPHLSHFRFLLRRAALSPKIPFFIIIPFHFHWEDTYT